MKKIITIFADGFGISDNNKGNAIKDAQMHNFEDFYHANPNTLLSASGNEVGLIENQTGNCQNSYQTIGAGRKILCEDYYILDYLENVDAMDKTFNELINDSKRRIHIFGRISDNEINNDMPILLKLHELLKQYNFENVFFHLITVGSSNSASKNLGLIYNNIAKTGLGSIASVCGGYFALNNNDNYNLTKIYYDLITKGIGIKTDNPKQSLVSSYDKGNDDDNIKPLICNYDGIIKDEDAIIWCDYHERESFQLLNALTASSSDVYTSKKYDNLDCYTFFPIKEIKSKSFIKNRCVDNSLGVYLSKLDIKQARIFTQDRSELLTNYFDSMEKWKISSCDKYSITRDEIKPEMNVVNVARKVIDCIDKDYDMIFASFSEAETQAKLGNYESTVKSCMAIDMCLSKIIEAAEANFYTIVLLSDHGCIEQMADNKGFINKENTFNRIPFVINDKKIKFKDGGTLCNVAATILDYMDISIPEQMTSESLIENE